MRILDGKKLSDKILQNLKEKVGKMKKKPVLAVVLVGNNKVSEAFINQKRIACEKAGVTFQLFQFSEKIDIEELKKEIKKIVNSREVSGVIIQLPLPKKFNPEEFLNLIPAEKDVDVLSEKSLGKFSQGLLPILPPTVGAIFGLLKAYKIETKGKNIVIMGAGRLIGVPLSIYLLQTKAIFSMINTSTKNPSTFIKNADILISGVGKQNLIKGSMVKKGVVIIDAGSSGESGKIVGDVHFASVSKKASYISPVPGGVGPMTVACLLENLIEINK